MYYHLSNVEESTVVLFIISYTISILSSMAATALIMVSLWHIFKKLGMPGWKGIIPYYGDYMLYKTVWKTKPFWVMVISSGVYAIGVMLTAIIMAFLLIIKKDSPDTDSLLYVFVIFSVIFALLTLAYLVIDFIITVKLNLRLAKAFGKGTGFALGLTFISIVFYPVLAFGKAQRVRADE